MKQSKPAVYYYVAATMICTPSVKWQVVSMKSIAQCHVEAALHLRAACTFGIGYDSAGSVYLHHVVQTQRGAKPDAG